MNAVWKTSDIGAANAQVLTQEYDWLGSVIELRQGLSDAATVPEYGPESGGSGYLKLVQQHNLSADERLLLLLALAPEINPGFLEKHFVDTEEGWKTVYGGYTENQFAGFTPTIKTIIFILSEGEFKPRINHRDFFRETHLLYQNDILRLSQPDIQNPSTERKLLVTDKTLEFIITGQELEPTLSPDFPAKRLHTSLNWEDLVLTERTQDHLKELLLWLEHSDDLMENWDLESILTPGYRCLFYGPPGTGKTLTAALLGKITNRPVYRIDLSRLVSKYIGETEKNLEKVFTRAAVQDWILFFDEADSVFGKRTQVSSSNDRYANQETSYLLQRIEDCSNPIVMASNLKMNIDEAFMRRFQSVVHFPMPKVPERLKLWEQSFSSKCILDESVDLPEIARQTELAGGGITNVIRFVSLMAIKDGRNVITDSDLKAAIYRELVKEGKKQ